MKTVIFCRTISTVPGILLCGTIALAALGADRVERTWFGSALLEPLVLAILFGLTVRSVWVPGEKWVPGVRVSAKFLLELAVMLLGASVSAATIAAVGLPLLMGVIALVLFMIVTGYGIARMFGLSRDAATLLACGNAICGNSAIAAVAPMIGAEGEDVAAAIAFTALLSVGVILALPPISHMLTMTAPQAGALAGLTVYAVPQVLAATSPYGALAVQTGTLIKLVRVMMLGPVCIMLSLLVSPAQRPGTRVGFPLPWFIIGFAVMAALRSLGLLPEPAREAMASTASLLTAIAMAALGLETDIRAVAAAGPRAAMAVTLSVLTLGFAAIMLVCVTMPAAFR